MAPYNDPGGIIAGSVVMWIIAGAAVGLRFYSMKWKRQSLTASEWLILSAFVFGTGITIMEIYGVAVTALGYPIGGTLLDPYAPGSRLNKTKHIQLAFLLLGIVATGLIKLSVCCLYLNLFGTNRTTRYILLAYIAFLVIWTISFVAAGLAECGNHLLNIFGTPTEFLATCSHATPTGISLVATDVATDFVTLIIPIPIVLRLQMSTRTKLLTVLTFLIGALAIGGSVAKAYIYIAGSYGQYTEDGLLLITGLSIWNLAEVQIGIVAACGPTLRQVIAHVLPTSESFRYLISRKSRSQTYTKGTEDLPSFVKMQDSAENLHRPEHAAVKKSADDNGQNLYEMDMRTGN